MFRKANGAHIMRSVIPFFLRGRKGGKHPYVFYTSGGWQAYELPLPITQAEYQELLQRQRETPRGVAKLPDGRAWWMFEDAFWVEDEDLSADEVQARILDKRNRERRRTERAVRAVEQHAAAEEMVTRPPIPDDVKMFVWQRDEGKCVNCGGRELLEFDHIIPLHMGGSNTARNLQLLCENCNRLKGGSLA